MWMGAGLYMLLPLAIIFFRWAQQDAAAEPNSASGAPVRDRDFLYARPTRTSRSRLPRHIPA